MYAPSEKVNIKPEMIKKIIIESTLRLPNNAKLEISLYKNVNNTTNSGDSKYVPRKLDSENVPVGLKKGPIAEGLVNSERPKGSPRLRAKVW
ncbi:hypothetical protein [Salinibacter ruber]|uniref:hypothetical protein n=1 Tax=Salinibacter ruber TaxID=146919 RepID=UPI0021678C26|nr:hypothetical protein [Salinibacter ruber]MCS4055906.1 hypothetical protein [Salinibacter ruber]